MSVAGKRVATYVISDLCTGRVSLLLLLLRRLRLKMGRVGLGMHQIRACLQCMHTRVCVYPTPTPLSPYEQELITFSW